MALMKSMGESGFLLFAVFLFLLSSCGESADESGRTGSRAALDSVVIELAGVDSVSVFELTRRDYTVIYESSRFGVFVKAIDGQHMGNDHFWVFTVNDTVQNVAADKYITRDGDAVKWHLRRVTQ